MKMMQQDSTFAPITIVIETKEEAQAFWELARIAENVMRGETSSAVDLAIRISDYLSNEAKL